MSADLIFPAKRPDRRATIMETLVRFLDANADYDVAVVAKRHREARSEKQNKALWGLAYKILHEATGNDPDDLHTFFLGECFGWQEVTVMGQRRRVPVKRSSKLDTEEFARFFDFIQTRAAQVGYFIPDPDPFWRETRSAA